MKNDLESLQGSTWQIEDVDQGGIIDSSMITIAFTSDGRIAGTAGCNRYFGAINQGSDATLFGKIGSTRRACAPALMAQENRVLDALGEVVRIDRQDSPWLVFYDASGVARLRAIVVETDSKNAQAMPEDAGSGGEVSYACEGGGEVLVRFVGPETLELIRNSDRTILQQERSASGALYVGDGIEFWIKGEEATLEISGQRYTCLRR